MLTFILRVIFIIIKMGEHMKNTGESSNIFLLQTGLLR